MSRFLQASDLRPGQETIRVPVSGDCLAGAGIEDGDTVGVALHRFPRPPKYYRRDGYELHDFCLCTRPQKTGGTLLVKEYMGVSFGMQTAGTHYRREPGGNAQGLCLLGRGSAGRGVRRVGQGGPGEMALAPYDLPGTTGNGKHHRV